MPAARLRTSTPAAPTNETTTSPPPLDPFERPRRPPNPLSSGLKSPLSSGLKSPLSSGLKSPLSSGLKISIVVPFPTPPMPSLVGQPEHQFIPACHLRQL